MGQVPLREVEMLQMHAAIVLVSSTVSVSQHALHRKHSVRMWKKEKLMVSTSYI